MEGAPGGLQADAFRGEAKEVFGGEDQPEVVLGEERLELAGEFVEALEVVGRILVRRVGVPGVGEAAVLEAGDVGTGAGHVIADAVAFAGQDAGALGFPDRQFVGGGPRALAGFHVGQVLLDGVFERFGAGEATGVLPVVRQDAVPRGEVEVVQALEVFLHQPLDGLPDEPPPEPFDGARDER